MLYEVITHDIARLPEYCRLVAEAVGVPVAVNYPVVGADAFRTGTGVHAAAIISPIPREPPVTSATLPST